MTSFDVITNKKRVNQSISQMKVGLYPRGVNQAQGYLLNVNYFCCVLTEQKHSNPSHTASWCGVRICLYVRVKPSIKSLQQTSVNLTFQRGNVPQRFTGRFSLWENLLSDANAGVQVILQRSRLHSLLTAYFCNEPLCRMFLDERVQDLQRGRTVKRYKPHP